jgi:hypothetical protein
LEYRQVNVRLPADDFRVLEAGAILEAASVAEYVKPMLDSAIRELRNDPAVLNFLRMRAERAAQKEGTLTPLAGRRRRDEGV